MKVVSSRGYWDMRLVLCCSRREVWILALFLGIGEIRKISYLSNFCQVFSYVDFLTSRCLYQYLLKFYVWSPGGMRCSSCFVLFVSVYISEMEFCVFLVITADTFNFRNTYLFWHYFNVDYFYIYCSSSLICALIAG